MSVSEIDLQQAFGSLGKVFELPLVPQALDFVARWARPKGPMLPVCVDHRSADLNPTRSSNMRSPERGRPCLHIILGRKTVDEENRLTGALLVDPDGAFAVTQRCRSYPAQQQHSLCILPFWDRSRIADAIRTL